MINKIIRQIKMAYSLYTKVFLVILSFLLMILSTSFFMGIALNNRLGRDVDNLINRVQVRLSSALLWPELPFEEISDNIQDMLRRGESLELVKAYMDKCSTPEYKAHMRTFTYYSIYGYFEDYDSFYDGGGWSETEGQNFIPKERPWYKAAMEANGKIVITPPYINMASKTTVMAYTRMLSDKQGKPLGVICLIVPMTYIESLIINNQITDTGFGILLDKDLRFIIHPDSNYLNSSLSEIPRLTEAANLLEHESGVAMFQFINYTGVTSLAFVRQLDNGWYFGIVIPKEEYYHDMYTTIITVSLIGIFMGAVLSVLLVKIDRAKIKSDLENKQKTDFLASMSHEIRTPMNTIMGITEMQLQDKSHSDSVLETFNRIYNSGDVLLKIINDLLDLSKIEAGKLEIQPAKYEVASLINEVIQLNKLRFDSKPVEFILNVGENIPETLIGDELRIRQILNNLLSNAFKYTRKGEVELSIAAEKGIDQNITLIFIVRDTGQGMTAEQIGKLFSRFTRFNLEANRGIEGTGLGLSIVQHLVNMMNGELQVKSEPKKGSAFTLRLPQKQNGSSAVLSKELVENLSRKRFVNASQVKRAQILRKYMPYGRVLIVDDIEHNVYVAKLLMNPYGLQIDSAASGNEAIEKIKDGKEYDIIFMDHMMPLMDGIEAVKIIRGMNYTRPIVALTANAVAGQADLFLSNGFDNFISKPIDMRLLDRTLNTYIYDKQTKEVTESAQMAQNKLEAQNNAEVSPSANTKGNQEAMPLNVSWLNIRRGLALFEDNVESYTANLYKFMESVPEVLDKLRTVTEKSLPEYTITVHSLKSLCGWICADGIQARAASLETLAKSGDFIGVTALNNDLINATEALLADLYTQLSEIVSNT